MAKTWQQVISRERFAELTRPLLGLEVSRPWRGYGSALFLELGQLGRLPPHKNPKGRFTVMIQWSWRIERARSIEAGSWSSERRIDSGIAGLAGPRVTELYLEGRLPELVIGLSDGRWVHSFMTAEGQPEWSIFLRAGDWITVERGRLIHATQNARTRRPTRAPAA
jgi:hypothetical protein